jgi:hypothetical protein
MEYIRDRQAALMLTTSRVGDPEEDPTMKKARPLLAAINRLGLITTDSQMGVARKQRAYVLGLATREVAARLQQALQETDAVIVLVFPHGESTPDGLTDFGLTHMPRLALTLCGAPSLTPCTQMPLGACQNFSEQWGNLLPELRDEIQALAPNAQRRLKRECQRDSVQFCVVDTMWGRPMWLFRTIVATMSPKVPKPQKAAKVPKVVNTLKSS